MHLIMSTLIVIILGCQTIGKKSEEPPPQITDDMDVEEALNAGVTHGGETLEKVKKLFAKRKDWPEVNRALEKELSRNLSKFENLMLLNAVNLYQASTQTVSLTVLDKLLASDNTVANSLGWNLAANFPSPQIVAFMDAELTKHVADGEEDKILLPQMASALMANQLVSGYSLARRGLMLKGDEVFAKAMIALNPKRAATDFLDYLTLASVEELRQLNQQSVNIYACLVALNHLTRFPPPINHPNYSQLFIYAVSRNKPLADLAAAALETSLPSNHEYMALLLSRLPAWIQVAFIESVKENVSPKFNRFFSELRDITPHEDVVEEIKDLKNI